MFGTHARTHTRTHAHAHAHSGWVGVMGDWDECNCLLFDKTKSSHLSEDTKLINSLEVKNVITQCDMIQILLNLEENGNDDVNFFTHVNSK